MFEIGTSLRLARQRRALEVGDVERETRIRAKYLVALEEERFDVLPGVAYVRGFLRTYAEFLGLDSDLLIDEFNEHFAPPEDEPLAIRASGLAPGGVRFGRPLLGVGTAATSLCVVAVWQLGFTSPERTTIPQATAAPIARPVVAPRPRVTPRPAAKPALVKVRRGGTLVVRAVRGDCWVAVRLGSARGPVVYQRIVGRGDVVRFGLRRALWVRLGAPWNADVSLRGKRLPAFPRAVVNLRAA